MASQVPSVHAQVEQTIDAIGAGARVYGMYIENLTVPQYPTIDPPDESIVIAYLERIRKKMTAPAGFNPAQRALWNTPIEVSPGPDQPHTRPVCEAVRDTLAQLAPQHFIQRLVLLGASGTGRTPALYQVRRDQAMASLGEWRRHQAQEKKEGHNLPWDRGQFIVPIYFGLAPLKAGLHVTTLIADAMTAELAGSPPAPDSKRASQPQCPTVSAGQVPGLLRKYRCLFLLDDLEVLLSEQGSGAIEALNHFMEMHDHQYVLSCHSAARPEQLGPVSRLYIAELPPRQAIAILGQERYERLSSGAWELVRNRAMLHRLLGQGEQAAIPSSKGRLVETAVYERLKGNLKEMPGAIELDLVTELLKRLALAMYLDRTYNYQERQLVQVIGSYLEEWHEPTRLRKVIDNLRDLDVLVCDERLRTYSFRDRRWQAYFAAAAVALDPEKLQLVLSSASDLWWHGLLEILIGLVPDPGDFLFELVDRDALVAAECAEQAGGTIEPRVIDAVIDGLLQRMSEEESERRRFIVDRIGKSTHPRAIEALIVALHQEWSSRVLLAITTSILEWQKSQDIRSIADLERQVLHAMQIESNPVAGILEACYRCRFGLDPQERAAAVPGLAQAIGDTALGKRARALAAIGLGFAGTQEACSILLAALVDPKLNDMVAWCAVETLGLSRGSQEVENAAHRLYRDPSYSGEDWERHRARAVYLLGLVSNSPETRDLLLRAMKDDNPFVRGYAVEGLAAMDLREGGALQKIERLLATERDPIVLRKVAEAMAHIGTASTIPKLEPHLRNERIRTRRAVQKAIAAIRQRHGL